MGEDALRAIQATITAMMGIAMTAKMMNAIASPQPAAAVSDWGTSITIFQPVKPAVVQYTCVSVSGLMPPLEPSSASAIALPNRESARKLALPSASVSAELLGHTMRRPLGEKMNVRSPS